MAEERIRDMGVRELARAAGIAPSTASRVKQGQTDRLDMVTAKAVLPFLSECPCCGGAIPSISPLATALRRPEVRALASALEALISEYEDVVRSEFETTYGLPSFLEKVLAEPRAALAALKESAE